MKTLTSKTDFDFLGKVTTFARKTDALSISLVFDSTSQKTDGSNGGSEGGGGGYRHPESLSGIQDQFTSASSSSGSSPSSPSSPPLSSSSSGGIKSYPVVFSFPPEADRHLAQCEHNHLAIVVSLIHRFAFGKTRDSVALSGFAARDSPAPVGSSKVSAGPGGCSSPQVLSLFDKTINTTYLVTNVEPNFYLVLIFEGKKNEKDSYVTAFLDEIASALQLSFVFRLLRPGSK